MARFIVRNFEDQVKTHSRIAGIALARRAAIATRNVRHFRDLATKIVNSWEIRRGAAAPERGDHAVF